MEQTRCKAFLLAGLSGVICVQLCAPDARAQTAGAPPGTILSFNVSVDEKLIYPSDLVDLPDEHTTILPVFDSTPIGSEGTGSPETFLLFGSSRIDDGSGGTVVLESKDLKTFIFAMNRGYGDQVMAPPVEFGKCDRAYNTEFDENYAAPGTVLQDPTLPPGNLIMFYEAENHCPGGHNQQPFYATVGLARSSDGGKTWPDAVDSELGDTDRRPVLKVNIPEPSMNYDTGIGDAIPSALVDGGFIYVAYSYHSGLGELADVIRVARADLSDAPLTFLKWYDGSFSQAGLGGLDSAVLPAGGCTGRRQMPEISRNDDLGVYLMIFVCDTLVADGHAAWYFSTATSLELQDWTTPRMIGGSWKPITGPCNSNSNSGNLFDGFYPSTLSTVAQPGHTRLEGKIFFQDGCDTGLPRAFTARTFKITPGP